MGDIVNYQLEIDRKLWDNFKACLRKVYWKEGMTIDKGIISLITKFVEDNK